MKSLLAGGSILLWSFLLQAQTILVPDTCAQRQVTPCLIRTQGQSFQFELGQLKIQVQPDSVLRLNRDAEVQELWVLDGRARVYFSDTADTADTPIRVNGVIPPDSKGGYLLQRSAAQFYILSLQEFVRHEYRIHEANARPVSSRFLDKKEFVDFSRYYFETAHEFSQFLKATSGRWRAKFHLQTQAQTKVLRRGLASVPEGEGLDRESDEAKKVREQFFFRTFHR